MPHTCLFVCVCVCLLLCLFTDFKLIVRFLSQCVSAKIYQVEMLGKLKHNLNKY